MIGVRHFDEFVERMQREEVEEIEAKVWFKSETLAICIIISKILFH